MLLHSNAGPELFCHSKAKVRQNGKRYTTIYTKNRVSQNGSQTNNLSVVRTGKELLSFEINEEARKGKPTNQTTS